MQLNDDNSVLVYDNGRGVIGGQRVYFQGGNQTEYGWGRKTDEPSWHSVRYLHGARQYTPRCGAPVWPHAPGDAILPILPSHAFGPVCAKCASLEGLNQCVSQADYE